MFIRRFEMPWRPAYELWAAGAWFICFLALLYLTARMPQHVTVLYGLSFAALLLTLLRARQGFNVLLLRSSLSGKAMRVMPMSEFASYTKDPHQLFMGFGFEWEPKHSQRLYDLSKTNPKLFTAPSWVLTLFGHRVNPQPEADFGLAYIHGVEPIERPIYRPLPNFEGGLLLVGTTQTGKGVAIGMLLTQAIRRGDIVIFVDPKNSKRLERVIRRACELYREPDTYLNFHPAFPEEGCRLDFLHSWQKSTEIASHMQAIMPEGKDGAVFGSFGWDAVNVVAQGLLALESRPNLLKLTRYISGGLEHILEEALAAYFDRSLPVGWKDTDEFRSMLSSAARESKRPSPATSNRLIALVTYYETKLPEHNRDKTIDAMVRVYRHNREHYSKITASLLPTLEMLTTGDLGRSLSPDPFDLSDTRPIMNFAKIEEGGHVLRICLDSLPDPSVGKAIASLAMADLAARSGIRYNLGIKRRITLVVDEMSNVVSAPLIEILNKGAEGGISSVVAMQTLGDLAARLGSVDAARMVLGNLNNLIALRSPDKPTQEYISESFGTTGIHSARVGHNHGADTHVGDWSVGRSYMLQEQMMERVPIDALSKLPNLQYFASLGGRVLKGRLTIIDPDDQATKRASKPPRKSPTVGATS